MIAMQALRLVGLQRVLQGGEKGDSGQIDFIVVVIEIGDILPGQELVDFKILHRRIVP